MNYMVNKDTLIDNFVWIKDFKNMSLFIPQRIGVGGIFHMSKYNHLFEIVINKHALVSLHH